MPPIQKSGKEMHDKLTKVLKRRFPASDPVSTVQPASKPDAMALHDHHEQSHGTGHDDDKCQTDPSGGVSSNPTPVHSNPLSVAVAS
jgi:hypothetical protein